MRWTRLHKESGIGNPVFVPYAGDYIAALLGSGSHERARSVVDRTLEQAEHTGLAWPRAIGLRGRGMLVSGPDADRDFAGALQAWPNGFDGARTRLAWAETLLARHEARRGRELLNLAAEEFSRLAARPWLKRTLALLGKSPEPITETDDRPGLVQRPDCPGTESSPQSGRRLHQPGGRRPTLHQRKDRRTPPLGCLHQAWHPLTQRAGPSRRRIPTRREPPEPSWRGPPLAPGRRLSLCDRFCFL